MMEPYAGAAPIRVLLVDDHPIVREGLRTLLLPYADLKLVGEASDGAGALSALLTSAPDVILLDINLPGVNGLELLHRIRERRKEAHVVILSMYDNESYLVEALQAGASGYLLKGQAHELIPRAIRTVVEGGIVVQSRLLVQALSRLPRAGGAKPDLTVRELDVLRLLTRGLSNRLIAESMNLAEITVKKHLQTLMGKLGTTDRTQTALAAVRLGLVD